MKGYEKAAQAIQSVKQVIIGKDDCVLAIMEEIGRASCRERV